jgi:hypothetical protein
VLATSLALACGSTADDPRKEVPVDTGAGWAYYVATVGD